MDVLSEIRLDGNECPTGPPPRAITRLVAGLGTLHRYPRNLELAVTAAVADYFQVAAENVLLTNGVDEAIDLALLDVLTAWTVRPGFDGYPKRAEVHGRTVMPIHLDERWQPIVDPAELARSGAVFLAQPNNPTGNLFNRDWVESVVATADLTFLDETYLEFCGAPSYLRLLERDPNLLLFRSFSKALGLAGTRLGALVGRPERIAALRDRRAFYSVNSVALLGVVGALEDTEHVAAVSGYVSRVRPKYVEVLRRSGLFAEVRSTRTNFVVARCLPGDSSTGMTSALGRRGVWVRDCAEFGLPGWVRVSVGSEAEIVALSAVLADLSATTAARAGVPATDPAAI